MDKVIEEVNEMCPSCGENKVLEIRERDTKGLVEGIEVSYKEEYTLCTDCEESWYSRNRKQLKKSQANAKLAFQNLSNSN